MFSWKYSRSHFLLGFIFATVLWACTEPAEMIPDAGAQASDQYLLTSLITGVCGTDSTELPGVVLEDIESIVHLTGWFDTVDARIPITYGITVSKTDSVASLQSTECEEGKRFTIVVSRL